MKKRVAVLLSGCGFLDGSEIHEAVCTLLALDKYNIDAFCISINEDQMHVVNHKTGDVSGENRNILVESARIARKEVFDIKEVILDDLSALILPGGFGAAKNFTDFAIKGSDCSINENVCSFIKSFFRTKKPIGAICIAPAVVAKALSSENSNVIMTIGNDEATARALRNLGVIHQNCAEGDIVVDFDNKIVSTPAYMYHSSISVVNEGIDKLVKQIVAWI